MNFLKLLSIPLLFLCVLSQAQNQKNPITDEDLEDFNKNYLQLFDRVKSVRIYEKSVSGPRNYKKENGEMVERREYYRNGTISSAIYYEEYPNEYSMFFFDYDSTKMLSCTQYTPGNDKEYQWKFLNDSLISEEIKFKDNGKIHYKWVREYNNDLEVIAQKKIKRNGKVVRRFEGELDDQGRITRINYYKRSDKLKKHLTIKYKDTTDLITEYAYYKKNKLKDRITQEFDDAGNLVAKTVYNDDNTVENIIKHQYDSLDRVVESETINSSGKTMYTEYFEYDHEDNLTNHTIETIIGLGRTIENEYNSFGNIKFRKMTTDTAYGTEEILAFFEYDDNGNLIEERTEHLKSNTKFIRTHEYDYYKNVAEEQSSQHVE